MKTEPDSREDFMLVAIRSSHAWERFRKEGFVAVEYLSDAMYLMEVARDSGRSVTLFQGEDRWVLVGEDPRT